VSQFELRTVSVDAVQCTSCCSEVSSTLYSSH